MLLAALGDIHGNLPAFDAVLGAIDDMGIQTIVNTGDCVAGHSWPNEVIDRLRSRAIHSVQGEMDRLAVRFVRKHDTLKKRCPAKEFEDLRWTYEHTRSDNLEFLRALPAQRTLKVEGETIYLCHGIGPRQLDALHESDDACRFRRLREIACADMIIAGRTHASFARWVDDTLFVNPGAVGAPVGEGAEACFAAIDTETEPWETRFHSVAYEPAV